MSGIKYQNEVTDAYLKWIGMSIARIFESETMEHGTISNIHYRNKSENVKAIVNIVFEDAYKVTLSVEEK